MLVRSRFSRSGLVAAVAAFVLLSSGCAADSGTGGRGGGDAQAPVDSAPAPAPAIEGEGDYAFGSDRDQMAYAIEQAFSTSNGKTRWEGDTLVLAVDGDATKTMAGFTQCRVLVELLTDDDMSAVEFPNGRVECVDVLAE